MGRDQIVSRDRLMLVELTEAALKNARSAGLALTEASAWPALTPVAADAGVVDLGKRRSEPGKALRL